MSEGKKPKPAAELLAPAYAVPGGDLSRHAPAVIVPITGTTAAMLVEEAIAAEAGGADLIEWRIDFMLAAHQQLSFAPLGAEVVVPILNATNVPLLLTIRTTGEGGEAGLSEGRYRLLLAELLDVLVHLEVPAERIVLDLEYWFDGAPAIAVQAQALGATVIISHHDWEGTPDSERMRQMFAQMLKLPGVVAKLAVTAHSDADVQRLLDACQAQARQSGRALIGIAMGEAGQRSRLEGWKYGSVATFATVGAASAPGQPTVAQLRAAL